MLGPSSQRSYGDSLLVVGVVPVHRHAPASPWLICRWTTQIIRVNSFIAEFLKWTLLFWNFDLSTDAKRGFSLKSKSELQTVTADPDETARYEPSHLDLQCLHRYWTWSAGLGGLSKYG